MREMRHAATAAAGDGGGGGGGSAAAAAGPAAGTRYCVSITKSGSRVVDAAPHRVSIWPASSFPLPPSSLSSASARPSSSLLSLSCPVLNGKGGR